MELSCGKLEPLVSISKNIQLFFKLPPSRVYIRLYKHGKRFLLLKHFNLWELMLFTQTINQIYFFLQVVHHIHF